MNWPGHRVDPTTGCWLYLGYIQPNGYPGTVSSPKKCGAHVAAYIRKYGPLPPGTQVDHLCRTRCCVNPDHMEAVTNAENSRRRISNKLTMDKAQLIRRLVQQGFLQEAIATRFGISQPLVSMIVSGERWHTEEDSHGNASPC